MTELFHKGINRIIYKSKNFATGKTVKAYIWNPNLVKSSLQTLTEIESGLYYLDYNFNVGGVFIALFLENSTPTTVGIYRVTTEIESIHDITTKLLQVQKGRWKIVNNQFIMYEEDGSTVLYKFDLKDKAGQPTERDVTERVPV